VAGYDLTAGIALAQLLAKIRMMRAISFALAGGVSMPGRQRRNDGGRPRRPAGRKSLGPTAAKSRAKKWSQHVTQTSNALDLEPNVFKLQSPRAVAASLKRSALRSKRRKAPAYQSAMSMLNFYINRGGRGLSASRKRVLERAKGELRQVFGRERGSRSGRSRT
jgi:uncharacterized protein DUF3175